MIQSGSWVLSSHIKNVTLLPSFFSNFESYSCLIHISIAVYLPNVIWIFDSDLKCNCWVRCLKFYLYFLCNFLDLCQLANPEKNKKRIIKCKNQFIHLLTLLLEHFLNAEIRKMLFFEHPYDVFLNENDNDNAEIPFCLDECHNGRNDKWMRKKL